MPAPTSPRRLRPRRVVPRARIIAAAASVATAACPASDAPGVPITWTDGQNDAQWQQILNWNPNQIPTGADSLLFPAAIPNAHATINLGSPANASSLTFDNGYTLTGNSVTLAGGQVTVNGGATTTIASNVLGSAGLTKLGTGTLSLAGLGAFTGGLTINAGTVLVDLDQRMGAAGGAVTINGGTLATTGTPIVANRPFTLGASGGTFAPGLGSILTLGLALTANANTLTLDGGGRLFLTAASTRTGATVVSNGILRPGNNTALGSGPITVNNTSVFDLGNVTVDQPMSLNQSSTLRADDFGGSPVSGTFAGTITVAAGATPILSSSSSANTITIGNGVNDYTGGAGATTTITGIFGGAGNGGVTLPFANDYAGDWSVNTGTLRIGNAMALGTGTSAVPVNAATMEINNVAIARDLNLNNTSTLRGLGANAAANGLTNASFGNVNLASGPGAADTLTVANLTGGPFASIFVSGGGTVVVPSASTFPGGWSVNAGTLRVLNASSFGTGTSNVSVSNGAALEIGGGATINRDVMLSNGSTLRGVGGAAGYTGTLTITNNAAVTLGAASSPVGDFTIGNAANDLTGGGGMSTITVPGTGNNRLILAQPSNYVGAWDVAGRLRVTADNQLGNAVNPVTLNGGILDVFSTFTSGRTFTSNDGFFSLQPGADLTLASGLGGGSGTLTKGGGGTLILQAASARTGDTLLFYTLRVEHPNALGTDGTGMINALSGVLEIANVTLNKPTTLNIDGALRGRGALARSNGVTTVASGVNARLETGFVIGSGSDVLTIGDAPNDLTGGGGGATLTVQGDGKVVLAQPSNFTGNWTVDFAKLQFAADDRLGNPANQLNLRSGELLLTGAVAGAGRNVTLIDNFADNYIDTGGFDSSFGNVDGPAKLHKNGAGTLTVNHLRGYLLRVNAGTLAVAPGGGLNGTSIVDFIEIPNASGRLDLTDSRIVVRSDLVGSWNGTSYTGVSGLVDRGRGNASNAQWNGAIGIVTSDTRAVNNNDLVSIGVARVGAFRNIANTATTTFGGLTVLGTDVVAMVTWGGDANLDGKINIDDYGQIDFNVSSSGSVFGWFNGDFNYDGKINIDDYGIIDFNVSAQNSIYPTGAAGGGLSGVAAVPEPASLSLAALCAAAFTRRRRHAPQA